MKLQVSFLLVSTLLVTATAVRIPYSYNQEAKPQGWPFPERGWQQAYMEAYLSELERANLAGSGGGVQTMQQEAILQEESVTHSIGVETLAVGQTISVSYLSPDKGRVTVNLFDDNNNYVLHADARYDWYSWKKVFILNSAVGSAFQKQEIAPGFPFPPEGMTTYIGLSITVKEGFFEIKVNGDKLYEYKYRGTLLPATVKRIQYRFGDTGAEKKAKLSYMAVNF